MKTLNILIPTIVGREILYRDLRDKLELQITSDVEIITLKDDKEVSIGTKRQMLLESSNSEYVVFIDDDDTVSEDYVTEVLKALESKPDCVGFEIECYGTAGKTASASNKYDKWAENVNGFDYVRTPYHKIPIKREIALQIGFKDMRYAEDYDFSLRLKESGLIKDEVYIPKVLYYYMYKYENPKTKYGLQN